MIQLGVARVTTPTHRYVKARASLTPLHPEDDDGPVLHQLEVRDRRTGAELLSQVGTLDAIDAGTWRFTEVESSDVSIVERSTGCGCGGTIVSVLDSTPSEMGEPWRGE